MTGSAHTHPGPPSRRAYQQGCRHPDCHAANAAYKRDRQRAGSRPGGVWLPMVPAGPSRRHVDGLLGAGWSLARVAAAAGVGIRTLTRLRSRETRRVTVAVADALRTVGAAASDTAAGDAGSWAGVVIVDGGVADPVDPAGSWAPPTGGWAQLGSCRSLTPAQAAVFFPTRGDDVRVAKRVCGGCVVVAECLAYALAHPSLVGVWGESTAEERKRLRSGGHVPAVEAGVRVR